MYFEPRIIEVLYRGTSRLACIWLTLTWNIPSRPAHSLILVTAHVLLMCSLLLFTGTIQDVFWNTPVLFGVVWYLCQLQGCLINCVTSKLTANKMNYLIVWSLCASWLKEWVHINTVHVNGICYRIGVDACLKFGISLVCNLTRIFTEW